jgi:acyl carrier protein
MTTHRIENIKDGNILHIKSEGIYPFEILIERTIYTNETLDKMNIKIYFGKCPKDSIQSLMWLMKMQSLHTSQYISFFNHDNKEILNLQSMVKDDYGDEIAFCRAIIDVEKRHNCRFNIEKITVEDIKNINHLISYIRDGYVTIKNPHTFNATGEIKLTLKKLIEKNERIKLTNAVNNDIMTIFGQQVSTKDRTIFGDYLKVVQIENKCTCIPKDKIGWIIADNEYLANNKITISQLYNEIVKVTN